jgi:hypothetical protein
MAAKTNLIGDSVGKLQEKKRAGAFFVSDRRFIGKNAIA